MVLRGRLNFSWNYSKILFYWQRNITFCLHIEQTSVPVAWWNEAWALMPHGKVWGMLIGPTCLWKQRFSLCMQFIFSRMRTIFGLFFPPLPRFVFSFKVSCIWNDPFFNFLSSPLPGSNLGLSKWHVLRWLPERHFNAQVNHQPLQHLRLWFFFSRLFTSFQASQMNTINYVSCFEFPKRVTFFPGNFSSVMTYWSWTAFSTHHLTEYW